MNGYDKFFRILLLKGGIKVLFGVAKGGSGNLLLQVKSSKVVPVLLSWEGYYF